MNLNEIIYKYSKILSFIDDGVSLQEVSEKSLYSLSTVKRVLHEIETEFGISFYSNKRQRMLTPEGMLVKEYFESVYKGHRRFEAKLVKKTKKNDSLRVCVAYPTTYYDSFFTLINADSKMIDFFTDYSSDIINEIKDNNYYDFGIVFCDKSNEKNIKNIDYRRLWTEDLYIVSNKVVNDWSDLRDMKELSFLTPNLWNYELDTWWSHHVKSKREIAYIPSVGQLHQLLAKKDESIFVFVYLHDKSEIQMTDICLKKVTQNDGEPVTHSMYLIWNPDRILTSDDEKFMERVSSLIYTKKNFHRIDAGNGTNQ